MSASNNQDKSKHMDSPPTNTGTEGKSSGDFTDVNKTNKAAQNAFQSETAGHSIGDKTGN